MEHPIVRQGRVACAALAGFAGVAFVFGLGCLWELVQPILYPPPPDVGFFDGPPRRFGAGEFATVLAFIVTGLIVLRWLYRAGVNARHLAPLAAISPGWNVGWFFVPVANLVKPLDGVCTIWQASVPQGGPARGAAPPLLHWWWAAWLTFSLFFVGMFAQGPAVIGDTDPTGLWIGLGVATPGIAAALLLRRIIAQVSAAQAAA